MSEEPRGARHRVERLRSRVEPVRERVQHTLVWNVWERMLETEFVDRSVALASKAFVSFFPLVIVVAAFLPHSVRVSVFSTLTHRLGVEGEALKIAKESFTTADEIRKATGVLGLILTFFFASSFTTALQRMYLRAWRRPPAKKVGSYARGPVWLAVMVGFMALSGAMRSLFGDGPGVALFILYSLIAIPALWTFTAWFMLEGKVRWRVLVPSGFITGLAMALYGASAMVWMSNLVTKNQTQFGFFGVALALVSWFSGAALCIMVGACAGPVLAEDAGVVGRFIRGRRNTTLVDGAAEPLPGPTEALRLRDAFRTMEDDVGPEQLGVASPPDNPMSPNEPPSDGS